MAGLMNHILSKSSLNFGGKNIYNSYLVQKRFMRRQNLSKQNKIKPKKLEKMLIPETRKLRNVEASVATRGFLRYYEDYTPPEDAQEKLEAVFTFAVGSPPVDNRTLIPVDNKFALLESCFKTFKHGVPNSILHNINTYGDLQNFYLTSVDATLPLDKLKKIELPSNLHIQTEAVRFLPEEATIFNGQTAYPKSNTLVTGLRAKRKYKGHIQTDEWPDVL